MVEQRVFKMAEKNINIPSNNITSEFDLHQKTVEECIEHIKIRQMELQSMITIIQAANGNLETLLMKEKDPKEKGKLYNIVRNNTEVLTQLYTTVAQFETVKHKYVQDIGRIIKDKNHMVHIELRSLDEKFATLTQNDAVSLILNLKELLKGTDRIDNQIKQTNIQETEYKMD